MHKEILSKEQVDLCPYLEKMKKNFGLVGGTAIALQIGHRRSIDFDLFSFVAFKNLPLKQAIERFAKINQIIVDKKGELTLLANQVKITFFHYPFEIEYPEVINGIGKTPDLLTLAAMKAYALGRRAKWKDYVDLYFILKNSHSVSDIVTKAKEIFGNEFNSKIFRMQLAYFDDVSFEEKVEFMPGFEVSEEQIKKELIEFSLE